MKDAAMEKTGSFDPPMTCKPTVKASTQVPGDRYDSDELDDNVVKHTPDDQLEVQHNAPAQHNATQHIGGPLHILALRSSQDLRFRKVGVQGS